MFDFEETIDEVIHIYHAFKQDLLLTTYNNKQKEIYKMRIT